MRPIVIGLLGLVAIWTVGFFGFLAAIPDRPATLATTADGIVVLTGGEDRFRAGMDLLDRSKGQRLLVSGVHLNTTRDDLARRLGGNTGRFDCCVDLDKAALTTHGNAQETSVWVKSHGYESLIVVTAHYHMPRSLQEFRRAMPGVEIIAYPVFPDSVAVGAWWHSPRTGRLLFAEYTKFIGSFFGLSF